MTPYARLTEQAARIHQLRLTAGWLEWDLATMMPSAGAVTRGKALAAQAVVVHDLLTSQSVADDIAAAREAGGLNAVQMANLSEIERRYRRAVSVPADLVAAQAKATTACGHAWETARAANDWPAVVERLKEVVALCRQQAAALRTLGYACDYDALLDGYDPGLTRARIGRLFDAVREKVPELVRQAVAAQERLPLVRPDVPDGGFPMPGQLALVEDVARLLGFDENRGRIDVSAHPFTLGTNTDVRITTRYLYWLETLMATVHEVGHALYILGLPADPADQPVSEDAGMSVHESQSLFMERYIGRSDAFVSLVTPMLHQHLLGGPSDVPEWQSENIARLVRYVEPQPVRVRADELTYGLHIVHRYELETALLDGDLEVEDLPDAWNDKLRELLGISAPDLADGLLQDTHWYSGLIGYYPTYLVGALMAAQLHARASRDLDIDACVAEGRLEPVVEWLKSNVHAVGRRKTGEELIADATGEPLSATPYLAHLEARYGSS